MTKPRITKLTATAVALGGLGGGLAATTAAAPAASASVRPQVVAFNWWRAIPHPHRPAGARHTSHYFPSVRPVALGGRYVKHPLNDIEWRQWQLGKRALGIGVLRHHGACDPACFAGVTLSHTKLRPGGHGHYYAWATVDPQGNKSSTIRLRWSFNAGNWVHR
jgi:hypothetical protein